MATEIALSKGQQGLTSPRLAHARIPKLPKVTAFSQLTRVVMPDKGFACTPLQGCDNVALIQLEAWAGAVTKSAALSSLSFTQPILPLLHTSLAFSGSDGQLVCRIFASKGDVWRLMASLNDAVDGRTWPESSEPEVCLPSALVYP